MRVHIPAYSAFAIILSPTLRNKPPLGGFPRRVTKRHPGSTATQGRNFTHEEQHMHKLAFIAGALAIMSAPALAASATSDKPIVVAEEGVSVSVGDHDHDHDRDHHRKIVVIHHHDDDHHRVIIRHHDDDHGDHDHDHDQH
jgi:hypothetical protein